MTVPAGTFPVARWTARSRSLALGAALLSVVCATLNSYVIGRSIAGVDANLVNLMRFGCILGVQALSFTLAAPMPGPSRRAREWLGSRRWALAVHVICELLAVSTVIVALRGLPLNLGIALCNLSPLVAILIARALAREPLGAKQAALLGGVLAGVALVEQPWRSTGAVDGRLVVLALLASTLFGMSWNALRALVRDRPQREASLFPMAPALAGVVVLGALVLARGSLREAQPWPMLCASGGLMACSVATFAQALRVLGVKLVTIVRFLAIAMGYVLQVVFESKVPGVVESVGTALLLASCMGFVAAVPWQEG